MPPLKPTSPTVTFSFLWVESAKSVVPVPPEPGGNVPVTPVVIDTVVALNSANGSRV